jgi:hypothetical protein
VVNGKRRRNVIETDGGNTLMLTEEEFVEVAKKMPPEEFQIVVLTY